MTRMDEMEEALKPLGFFIFFSFLLHPYTYTANTLPGKRILVSDATSTIGEGIAYEYARVKTFLVLGGSNATVLARVAARCQELGAVRVTFVAGDVLDAAYRSTLVRQARSSMGGLDHLLLNHEPEVREVAWPGTDGDGGAAALDRATKLHFTSYVALVSEALPMLIESQGCIGTVSSLVGKVPVPGAAVHSAGRAALLGFFTALRQEMYRRRTGVTVTSVNLGFVVRPDGTNAFGKDDPFTSPLLTVSVADATESAIIAVAHEKPELSYPFLSQLTYGAYVYFPNLYESVFRSLR